MNIEALIVDVNKEKDGSKKSEKIVDLASQVNKEA